MYSNDDEQRRWDDQQRQEQRRRDDEAAYARRQQEQRNHAEAYARRDAQDREWDAQRRQEREDDERHDQEWNEWRKRQAGPAGHAAHSQRQSVPLRTTSTPNGKGLMGLVVWSVLLAVPFVVYLALNELIQKFPRYAMDPSVAGQMARVFVQTLGGEWAQTLHRLIKMSWWRKDFGILLLYGIGVWVVLVCLALLLNLMFRIHAAVGFVASLALVSAMGLFFYVLGHFS